MQFADSNSVRREGFAIRGVGTFAFADGTEQSVSVVVDSVVLGRPGMGTGDLPGIAQVDVLRGPQGMLFGKGGSAGVVSITTHNPVQKFEVDARASYGTEYKFTPDVMGYATDSRGYKGPGIGLVSGYQLGQPLFTNPEIPTNYEIGFKTAWFARKLVVNVDVFTTDIKDFQTQVATPFVFNGTNLAILQIANAGKVRTRGIELDFNARPTARLSIGGNAAYIDAKYAYFPNGTCNYAAQVGCFASTTIPGTTTTVPKTTFFNDTGNSLPNSPKFTFSLNAAYTAPVSAGINAFIKANYNWRSSVNYSANADPLTFQRGYGIAGGQIGMQSADGRWNAAVFARNLFDTHFVTAISNGGSYQTAWLTAQSMRTVGVLAEMKF